MMRVAGWSMIILVMALGAGCGGEEEAACTEDPCGVCDTDPSNDCVVDCAGEPGGAAAYDRCFVCDADPTNNCVADCDGDWGGTATEDCRGVCKGTALEDECGTCDTNPDNNCEKDCNGDWGGGKVVDCAGECGGGATLDPNCPADTHPDYGCVGGNTGKTACVKDCAQVWAGTAIRDNCNECVEGTTGKTACAKDCNGVDGGSAKKDCAEVCGGTAYLDYCNECVGGTTGNEACSKDCYGIDGGTAQNDCNGDCDGTAYADPKCPDDAAYGCVGGNTGKTACEKDCHGDWGGTAKLDENCPDDAAYGCVGGNTGKTACTLDCEGTPNGTKTNDCKDICGGPNLKDECGTCDDDPANNCQRDCYDNFHLEWETRIEDCNRDCLGTAYADPNCPDDAAYGCVGGNTGKEACEEDCHGDWGGTAKLDENCPADTHPAYGCVGGNTGKTACKNDCNEVLGGTAEMDNCQVCVGGDTGKEACSSDCNGIPGGSAQPDCDGVCDGKAKKDQCGICDTDPDNDCQQDCAGDWGGTKTVDDCGNCLDTDSHCCNNTRNNHTLSSCGSAHFIDVRETNPYTTDDPPHHTWTPGFNSNLDYAWYKVIFPKASPPVDSRRVWGISIELTGDSRYKLDVFPSCPAESGAASSCDGGGETWSPLDPKRKWQFADKAINPVPANKANDPGNSADCKAPHCGAGGSSARFTTHDSPRPRELLVRVSRTGPEDNKCQTYNLNVQLGDLSIACSPAEYQDCNGDCLTESYCAECGMTCVQMASYFGSGACKEDIDDICGYSGEDNGGCPPNSHRQHEICYCDEGFMVNAEQTGCVESDG